MKAEWYLVSEHGLVHGPYSKRSGADRKLNQIVKKCNGRLTPTDLLIIWTIFPQIVKE